MGCHTWFYKKADPQPEYEEIRLKYLKMLDSNIEFYTKHINGTLDENTRYLFEDSTIEDSIKHLEITKRIRRIVEKRLCKVATVRHATYCSIIPHHLCERNGQLYLDAGLHDVFRIGDYPEDELLSFEETLQFLERNNDKIFWGSSPDHIGREEVIKRLKEFWDKNPDGLIEFG